MNYNEIAKFVHGLVKNQEQSDVSTLQINTHEIAVIKKSFSELEVSGDAVGLESIPVDFWV